MTSGGGKFVETEHPQRSAEPAIRAAAGGASGRSYNAGMSLQNRSVAANDVLPHVIYQDLPEAIRWLTRVFGFEECYRYGDGPRGAQMMAGRAAIQVRQAHGERSPKQLGYGTQSLTIFVDDVDRHYAHAKAAGARILEEPHSTVYGEYQYGAEDLDGHPWLFSRHERDVSPEEWGAVSTRP